MSNRVIMGNSTKIKVFREAYKMFAKSKIREFHSSVEVRGDDMFFYVSDCLNIAQLQHIDNQTPIPDGKYNFYWSTKGYEFKIVGEAQFDIDSIVNAHYVDICQVRAGNLYAAQRALYRKPQRGGMGDFLSTQKYSTACIVALPSGNTLLQNVETVGTVPMGGTTFLTCKVELFVDFSVLDIFRGLKDDTLSIGYSFEPGIGIVRIRNGYNGTAIYTTEKQRLIGGENEYPGTK